MLGVNWLERSFAEEDLGVLVDTKVNVSQQHALAARKANCIVGCIRKSVTSRSKEVIFSIYPALVRPHLQCCVQFWVSQYKRDVDIEEWVHWRSTKVIKGPQRQSSEEKMQKLGLFNFVAILSVCINASWDGVKKVESDSSHWYLWKARRQWVWTEIQVIPFKHNKKTPNLLKVAFCWFGSQAVCGASILGDVL